MSKVFAATIISPSVDDFRRGRDVTGLSDRFGQAYDGFLPDYWKPWMYVLPLMQMLVPHVQLTQLSLADKIELNKSDQQRYSHIRHKLKALAARIPCVVWAIPLS